jgi:hypothetical protein
VYLNQPGINGEIFTRQGKKSTYSPNQLETLLSCGISELLSGGKSLIGLLEVSHGQIACIGALMSFHELRVYQQSLLAIPESFLEPKS